MNIGRSKMETYINAGVYDLLVDIVRAGKVSGRTGHRAGHREIDILGSKELPQRLGKCPPRRRMSGYIIGKVRSEGQRGPGRVRKGIRVAVRVCLPNGSDRSPKAVIIFRLHTPYGGVGKSNVEHRKEPGIVCQAHRIIECNLPEAAPRLRRSCVGIKESDYSLFFGTCRTIEATEILNLVKILCVLSAC